MKLNTNILYANLTRYFYVERKGRNIRELRLTRPVFFTKGTHYQENGVYIGRSDQFVQPSENVSCMLICVGSLLPSDGRSFRQQSILSLPDENDIFLIFNTLTHIYDMYDQWVERMENILEQTASLSELLDVSAEIFCDTDLHFCNEKWEMEASTNNDQNTANKLLTETFFIEFRNTHMDTVAKRTPYRVYTNQMDTFNINLYVHNVYHGVLTICSSGHTVSAAEEALFLFLSGYCVRAMEKKASMHDSQSASFRSIAGDLLNGIPVDYETYRIALKRSNIRSENAPNWICYVIQPFHKFETLTDGYICNWLEKHFSNSFSFLHEPHIVFCQQINEDKETARQDEQIIINFLEKLSLFAGLSYPFDDFLKIWYYYRQAVNALDVGTAHMQRQPLYKFQNCALMYALKNSSGELPREYLIPPELYRLCQSETKKDEICSRQVLKVYLDNEMNISKASAELCIHRSTLQKKIETIQQSIPLDTPEQRMFIRFCLYLYEFIIQ